jgi:hypothetical protein
MTDPKKQPDVAKPSAKPVASVPDWGDPVCSCEAEPYWLEVEEELERQRRKKEAPSSPSENE